ncbi:MAG TPA: hypothetical protein VFV52_07500 [Bacilli bacterium]|nr:hypothetical protein [Bacilli bacterium]
MKRFSFSNLGIGVIAIGALAAILSYGVSQAEEGSNTQSGAAPKTHSAPTTTPTASGDTQTKTATLRDAPVQLPTPKTAPPVQANAGAPTQTGQPEYQLPEQSLHLPDGTVIGKDEAITWKHMHGGFWLMATENQSTAYVVGNHATVTSEETVDLPSGPAVFAIVERTPPAASGLQTVTQEYWLIQYKKDPRQSAPYLAFSISMKTDADPETAKRELLEVGNYWQIGPKS